MRVQLVKFIPYLFAFDIQIGSWQFGMDLLNRDEYEFQVRDESQNVIYKSKDYEDCRGYIIENQYELIGEFSDENHTAN